MGAEKTITQPQTQLLLFLNNYEPAKNLIIYY